MDGFFNELSLTPMYGQRADELMDELLVCLAECRKLGVNNVRVPLDFLVKAFLNGKVFKSYIDTRYASDDDRDKKSLLLGMLTTLESVDSAALKVYSEEEYWHGGNKCSGMGYASVSRANSFCISFDSSQWREEQYEVEIRYMGDEEVECENTICRNVSSFALVRQHAAHICPERPVPTHPKLLHRNHSKWFENLVLSEDAKSALLKLQPDAVAQVYARMKELNEIVERVDRTLAPEDFQTKVTPESNSRKQQFSFRFSFKPKDGSIIERDCDWHARYTPGAGRIHFWHDVTNHKIWIGYIGEKIK